VAATPSGEAAIEVQDGGPGIPAGHREGIVEHRSGAGHQGLQRPLFGLDADEADNRGLHEKRDRQ
jgi:hypothetical protein